MSKRNGRVEVRVKVEARGLRFAIESERTSGFGLIFSRTRESEINLQGLMRGLGPAVGGEIIMSTDGRQCSTQ